MGELLTLVIDTYVLLPGARGSIVIKKIRNIQNPHNTPQTGSSFTYGKSQIDTPSRHTLENSISQIPTFVHTSRHYVVYWNQGLLVPILEEIIPGYAGAMLQALEENDMDDLVRMIELLKALVQ